MYPPQQPPPGMPPTWPVIEVGATWAGIANYLKFRLPAVLVVGIILVLGRVGLKGSAGVLVPLWIALVLCAMVVIPVVLKLQAGGPLMVLGPQAIEFPRTGNSIPYTDVAGVISWTYEHGGFRLEKHSHFLVVDPVWIQPRVALDVPRSYPFGRVTIEFGAEHDPWLLCAPIGMRPTLPEVRAELTRRCPQAQVLDFRDGYHSWRGPRSA